MPASTSRASDGLRRLRAGGAAFVAAILVCLPVAIAAPPWLPLAKDGVHDPAAPALGLLQQPGDALSRLPSDTTGNMVRWVRAIESGAIKPRTTLQSDAKVEVLDLDVLLNLKGGQPIVRFPHRAHTLWLDCSNCHEHLFVSKIGANKLSMFQILQGEQCGVCHGAVSFPLTECRRCHSVVRPKPGQPLPEQPGAATPARSSGP